jgi:hypothetical protein
MGVNIHFIKFPIISHSEHSRRKEHIRVSLCKAKIDATMTGHLLRGMKLRRHVRVSNRPSAHVGYEPISIGNKGVIPPFRREIAICYKLGPVN